jgi:3-oxoacyl-[acyl-carrier-protein] synthase II
MVPTREIVITGVGVVSPIGIGNGPFWASLAAGRSGVRPVTRFDAASLPCPFGGEVADFDPKRRVRPRKSLKVMCRDIQLAFAAADLAAADAGFGLHRPDPERLGVVFGAELMPCEPPEMTGAFRQCMVDGTFDFDRWGEAAMAEMYPLWMLKYLPNMPACHVGIAQDARGPNNSLTLGEVSSLAAIQEAVRVLQRGHADVMIAGGTSSRIHPTIFVRSQALQVSRRAGDPAAASRPFDADRDGLVNGEGAGVFILETRRHAEARAARIRARVLGLAATFEPHGNGRPCEGSGIASAITLALGDAGLAPRELGHVNAHGMSTTDDDRIEARAIRRTLGDVPVTAPKSFFGYLGAGGGAVETAVSVLAFEHGLVPATLNYERPDPACPVNVISGRPLPLDKPTALILNHAQTGQAAAILLAGPPK